MELRSEYQDDMSIVRQSKFRHVFCKPVKHEHCLADIKITEITWDSLFCAVNPKFIAIIVKGAGGPFIVLPINKAGRIDKDAPLVDAHRGPCLEVAWSPFNDNVIASCSEDTTCKVWMIPEHGLNRTLSEPIVELNGHQKRVNTIVWHPTANHILLTAGGENRILIWNVSTGEALIEISGHPDLIWSVAFNYDGSKLVTTCKDRKIRVIDPRTGTVLQQGYGHEGVKPQKAIYLKDGRILSTGFTKRSERLYALRDEEKLEEPIVQEELDTSNGVLFPLYDEDTGLVYLVGKGDCAIRYYEVNNEYPFMHYINTYTTSEPQRAIGFMPKRGMNVAENEIARIYKVTTKGIVDNLQFFVPRKSDLFQDDLYPDTKGITPSLQADEWLSGANADPILVPVNKGAADAKPRVTVAKKANILAQMPSQSPPQLDTTTTTTAQSSTSASPRQQQLQSPPTAAADSSSTSPRASQKRAPISSDDDIGIVKLDRSASSASSTTTNRQANLRSRSERDDGGQTAGQKRAAAELERIRREREREPDVGSSNDLLPPTSASHGHSPRGSISSAVSIAGDMSMDELIADVQKMKTIIRQHERRIRLLEDQLADRNMADAYGF